MTLHTFEALRRFSVACLALVVLVLATTSRAGATGVIFGSPAALNTNAATDTAADVGVHVATDKQGNWVAIWQSGDSHIVVAHSADNGATWNAPVTLFAKSLNQEPQIATDSLGNWVAVWTSFDNLGDTLSADGNILVARSTNNGETWTAPGALSAPLPSTGGESAPNVTTDGAGHWIAVWVGPAIGNDPDILIARSTDNGGTWTMPVGLNTNAGSDTGPDLDPHVTTDGAGHWVAVWESLDSLGGTIGTDGDILVARSTDNGATWTAPAPLNTNAATDTGDDFSAHVATDRAGHWVAVWGSNDSLGGTIGTDADILVARSIDNGASWTAPIALNTNAGTNHGNDVFPAIATDGVGKWIAVWTSDDSLAGTIGTDYDILVGRSTDNGATWTITASLNTNAATDSGNDYDPDIVTDEIGHWIVAWRSDDSLGSTIGTDDDILVSLGNELTPTPTPTQTSPSSPSTTTATPTPSPSATPTVTATPTSTPAPPPFFGKPARVCQMTLAIQARTFAVAEHKLIQKCLDNLLADTAAGKGTAKAASACLKALDVGNSDSFLARATASAAAKIAKKCATVIPSEIDRPCDPAAPTVTAMTDCLLASYAATVEEQIAAAYADACTLITMVGIESQFPRICPSR